MQLKHLQSLLATSRLAGDRSIVFTDIQTDSRLVAAGDLFICLPGHTVDGHDYAAQAVEKGAVALIVERELPLAVPQLLVRSSRHAMAVAADAFFNQPSRRLKLIGVTGTNGKTTTTFLIERLLRDAGLNPGVIGTIERRWGEKAIPMNGTTPEALELQRSLAQMLADGTDSCVMEVSSHALEQGRVKGCNFRGAIFTNLTQDHLDYHGTMEAYLEAKALLFSRLGNTFALEPEERSYAVLNNDDPASRRMAAVTAVEVLTYGISSEADVQASSIRVTPRGTSFHVRTFAGETDIDMQLVGTFNVYNALAALTAGLAEGIPLERLAASLAQVPGVPGRVEAVQAGQPFAVIVDYAHTPDGLENVLREVKGFTAGRLICVFGCGGDRDRTKRPLMGEIAGRLADEVLVTSDNPRSEEPIRILEDIEQGLLAAGIAPSRYSLIADRREAIEKAVEMASPDDVVLIAGKGHETYQIIGSQTLTFDDRQVAKEAIRRIGH